MTLQSESGIVNSEERNIFTLHISLLKFPVAFPIHARPCNPSFARTIFAPHYT
jgi:hypothetical protein